MMRRKGISRWGFMAAMVIAVFLVSGFSQRAECKEKKEIKFGTTLSLTGMFASFGNEGKLVYEMAVDDINKDGGIYVKELGEKLPVKLVVYDDESDVAKGTAALEKLIRGDKVDILLGGIGGVNDVTGPIADKYKILWVGSIYPRSIFKGGFKFVVLPFHTGDDEAFAFFSGMRSLPKDQQPKTVALYEELSPDGDENARGCETMADKFGFKIVLHEKYTPGSDPTSFLLKCKKTDVDIVYMLPNPPDAVNIIKRSKEIGWAPKAWGFTRGTAVSYFGQALGKDSDYVFGMFAWHPACKRPGSKELVKRVRAVLGHDPFLAGIWYANVQVARAAIEKAGSLDKKKIRDAAFSLDIDTTAGRMAFKPNGRWKFKQQNTMLFQWQNGKLEIVWPEDQKTAEMWYPTKPWAER
jgi:branched-chain amino acid transport system substrate-binding protein